MVSYAANSVWRLRHPRERCRRNTAEEHSTPWASTPDECRRISPKAHVSSGSWASWKRRWQDSIDHVHPSPSYKGCPIPNTDEVPRCRSSRNLCYGPGVTRFSGWMVIDECMEKTMLFVRCCWFSRLCAEGKLTLWLQSPGYGSLRNYRVQRFGLTRYKGDTVVDWVPQQYFLIVLCTLINPDSLSTTDRQRLGDCALHVVCNCSLKPLRYRCCRRPSNQ